MDLDLPKFRYFKQVSDNNSSTAIYHYFRRKGLSAGCNEDTFGHTDDNGDNIFVYAQPKHKKNIWGNNKELIGLIIFIALVLFMGIILFKG